VHTNKKGREMAGKKIVTTIKIFKYENGRTNQHEMKARH
jgi:uncharacterized protein (DUF1015 family)